MELKTLWLGLLVSMGAFAVKTGLGWAYLWSKCPPGRKALASALVVGLYALLFGLVHLLVARLNPLAHYELLAPLWRSGVTLHWLVAACLFLWGLILLKSPAAECAGRRSRGWLALVVPCPVCLSVVLMAAAGLILYFPDQAPAATAALLAAFLTIAALSGLVFIVGRNADSQSLEATLGLAMIMMALYFMVSALVMPQFSELSQVYRLAAYADEGRRAGLGGGGPLTVVLLAALAALGFAGTRRRLKKQRLTR